MGITKGALNLLYHTRESHDFRGALLQLGRQSVFITNEVAKNVAKAFGQENRLTKIHGSFLDDQALFGALGFSTVESIDYSDGERPTHLHDMNLPVPSHLHNKYDVIYDGGTLEHIFNLPQSLKNIHAMLKNGGIVIHHSPSCNFVDHGFYSFSPTMFYDFYSQNKWDILQMYLVENKKIHNDFSRPIKIYDYVPGGIRHLSMGGWGGVDKLLMVWCVAKKTTNSSCNVIPQQSMYLQKWSAGDRNESNGASNNVDNFYSRFLDGITFKMDVLSRRDDKLSEILIKTYNLLPFTQLKYRKKPPVKKVYK